MENPTVKGQGLGDQQGACVQSQGNASLSNPGTEENTLPLLGVPFHDRTTIAIVLKNHREGKAPDIILGGECRDGDINGV